VPTDPRPLYDRIVEALMAMIAKGAYRPGDKLPSEQVLAEQLGISRPTVREAIGYLQSQGFVSRRRGIGTFVAALSPSQLHGGMEYLESVWKLAAEAGLPVTRESWSVEVISAPADVAAALECRPGLTLVRAELTYAIQGRLFAYMAGYVPLRLVDVDDLRAYAGGSLLDFIADRKTPAISHTQTEVHAIKAKAEIAARLAIPKADAVLHLAETYISEAGQPVVRHLNYFLTDYFNFHIVRRVRKR
jgi:GntR family transcriptional regulator